MKITENIKLDEKTAYNRECAQRLISEYKPKRQVPCTGKKEDKSGYTNDMNNAL